MPARCFSAAWFPNGTWMYFSANTGSGFHIWRQRFPDGKPEQVTFGTTEEAGISFAPDGKSFFTSIGASQSTVWIHDFKGNRQITSEGFAVLPSLSSDGKKLYYLVGRPGAQPGEPPLGTIFSSAITASPPMASVWCLRPGTSMGGPCGWRSLMDAPSRDDSQRRKGLLCFLAPQGRSFLPREAATTPSIA
jgi:Tol biopolymer transport system component